MAKGNGGLILMVGGAAAAWWAYTQGWLGVIGLCPSSMYPSVDGFGVPNCKAGAAPPAITPLPLIAPANPPTSTPPVSTPPTPPATTPANLAAQLTAAAGSSAQFGLTPDQWSYYYAQLPGRSPIPADKFATMLSKASITDATRSNPQDVNYFVGMLSSVGLSGFGGLAPGVRRYIPLPQLVMRGRGFGQYTMKDLRRAGRR